LNGILIIDKPAGISSAKAVSKVKWLLKAKKVGHAGTLDPFATGLLICCINQATKLAEKFLHGNKIYQATLRLGIETDTQDLTGNIISQTEVPEISSEQIAEVFKSFEGETDQIPPAYSALKHQGVPLYKLARRGIAVEKPARKITIFSMEIDEISLPEIRFTTKCSSGTYIRTLAADIGKKLGCGAHLIELRRIESSNFHISQAIDLQDLEQAVITGDIDRRIIEISESSA
jgi:tRNA pseudouridine55 synthase